MMFFIDDNKGNPILPSMKSWHDDDNVGMLMLVVVVTPD